MSMPAASRSSASRSSRTSALVSRLASAASVRGGGEKVSSAPVMARAMPVLGPWHILNPNAYLAGMKLSKMRCCNHPSKTSHQFTFGDSPCPGDSHARVDKPLPTVHQRMNNGIAIPNPRAPTALMAATPFMSSGSLSKLSSELPSSTVVGAS